MGLATGLMVYFLIWWTVLFAVLPLGVRPDPVGDPEAGGWRGAPESPGLGRKALITTLVSTVLWVGVEALVRSDLVSFREGWLAMPVG